MKNFIFACVAVVLLAALTAVSSATVGAYTDETVALVESGSYQAAYDLFEQKKTALSLTVSGGDLKKLEENLIDLITGKGGAKEKVISVCEDINSRQRIGVKTLF